MLSYKTSPVLYNQYAPVDAHIRIYQDGNAYKAELYIAGMHPQRFGIGLTPQDVAELNKGLQGAMQEFFTICEDDKVSDDMLWQLANAGKSAFNRIFAEGTPREIIYKLQGILRTKEKATIEISSENFFIPWELLYGGSLNEDVDFFGFWGAKYILARTLIQDDRPSDMVPPGIETTCPQVGLVTCKELKYVVEKEIPALRELDQQKRLSLSPLDSLDSNNRSKELKVFGNFLVKEPHIVHFACHSYVKSPSDFSYLRISDYFDITMQDFYAREFRMEYNPFVILNACRTGTISPLCTSNWAALFLKYGARGVLATEYSIPDWFAAVFIPLLYKYFLSGVPIGEALWATRRLFWNEKRNPLGLAYALYSPLAVRIGIT